MILKNLEGINEEPDKIVSDPWPKVWETLLVGNGSIGSNQMDRLGARVTCKSGTYTYSCPCGANFSRKAQEKILLTRMWVSCHFDHLPVEERSELI